MPCYFNVVTFYLYRSAVLFHKKHASGIFFASLLLALQLTF